MRRLFTFFVLAFLLQGFINAQIPSGYYNSAAGKTGQALKSALYNIIKGQKEYPYTSTSTDVWDILKESDRDPNNPNNVILFYTGWSVNAAQEYNSGKGWTREHVWAKSRGDFGTATGPGTDCHNLRPVDVSVNSARGNRWFAECDEMYYDNGVATGCYTSSTQWVWKPRDEVKGDVARVIFYMATRYEGENGEPDLQVIDSIPSDKNTKLPIHAKLSDLLKWNQEDPVSDFERHHNDVVYSYQHNRNPFIDHPEYVDEIWGTVSIPSAPTNLALNASDSQIDLTWTDVTKETGYHVYRSTDNTNFSSIATLNANVTSYSDASVTSGKLYYYYVKAFSVDGESAASNTVSGQLSGSSSNATDLFFSEYVEGSSYNKALEISNFTGANVDLSSYVIKKQTNGAGSWSSGLSLSGTISQGKSYVIANSRASQTVLDKADLTTGVSEMTFNGNDPVSLWKNGVLIDIIGTFNSTASFGTDVTMIRNADVSSPNTTYTTSEWTDKPKDYFDNLGTHTFNGGSTADTQAPSAPASLAASNITQTTLDLSWTASTDNVGVTAYDVYENGSLLTSTNSANYSVTGLSAGTSYSFYVKAKDAAGNVSAASSSISATTLTPVVNYCSANATNTDYEYINRVKFNSIDKTSGTNGGYADFTSISTTVLTGNTYTINLYPGFVSSSYGEAWAVWIDYNHDGDFSDAGELVYSHAASSSSVTGSVTIPSSAVAGSTRMRVAMEYNTIPSSACGSFTYGEVEDYTVNIGFALTSLASVNENNQSINISIYPNPAKDKLFINNAENSDVNIYSLNGKLVLKQKLMKNYIDLSKLNAGMYIIRINNGENIYNSKFVKQ